jgi:hypothetical protein
MLPMLAQRIETILQAGSAAQDIQHVLAEFMPENAVSVRDGVVRSPLPQHVVPVSVIRPSAWCKVIYLPPFYLVYTPGFLEETAPRIVSATEAHSQARTFRCKS